MLYLRTSAVYVRPVEKVFQGDCCIHADPPSTSQATGTKSALLLVFIFLVELEQPGVTYTGAAVMAAADPRRHKTREAKRADGCYYVGSSFAVTKQVAVAITQLNSSCCAVADGVAGRRRVRKSENGCLKIRACLLHGCRRGPYTALKTANPCSPCHPHKYPYTMWELAIPAALLWYTICPRGRDGSSAPKEPEVHNTDAEADTKYPEQQRK